MHFPTNTIGPIIASYITDRPSELKQCPFRGACNYNGLSTPQLPWLTAGGRFKAKTCICFPRYCLDMPLARWKAAAWTVILVLQKPEASAKRRVVDQRLQSNELKDKMPSMGEAAVADGNELQEIGGGGGKCHSASGGNGQPIYMPPKPKMMMQWAAAKGGGGKGCGGGDSWKCSCGGVLGNTPVFHSQVLDSELLNLAGTDEIYYCRGCDRAAIYSQKGGHKVTVFGDIPLILALKRMPLLLA